MTKRTERHFLVIRHGYFRQGVWVKARSKTEAKRKVYEGQGDQYGQMEFTSMAASSFGVNRSEPIE